MINPALVIQAYTDVCHRRRYHAAVCSLIVKTLSFHKITPGSSLMMLRLPFCVQAYVRYFANVIWRMSL